MAFAWEILGMRESLVYNDQSSPTRGVQTSLCFAETAPQSSTVTTETAIMCLKLLPLLFLTTSVLSQTVTITRGIPSSGHDCVRHCLFRPYNAGTDLGDVLECGPPYEEECYCPTAVPRAEIVSRHIDDCASESCSAGDVTADIDSMRAAYAGYCVDNGYTAELVEEWYSSAEETATTTDTTTAADETTTDASTSQETEGTSTSTTSDTPTETEAEEDDDGRNPDGLPDMDLDGEGAANRLLDSNMMVFIAGLVPVVSFLHWL